MALDGKDSEDGRVSQEVRFRPHGLSRIWLPSGLM